jgi:RNA polymerase-binding transcription factor DksA
MNISKTSDRSVHTHVRRALDEASRTRGGATRQFPDSTDDLAIEAQRLSIESVLDEVRSALTRLEDGSYGMCLGCMTQIPMETAEAAAWAGFSASDARRLPGRHAPVHGEAPGLPRRIRRPTTIATFGAGFRC